MTSESIGINMELVQTTVGQAALALNCVLVHSKDVGLG